MIQQFPHNLDDLSLVALHELSQKIRRAANDGWAEDTDARTPENDTEEDN